MTIRDKKKKIFRILTLLDKKKKKIKNKTFWNKTIQNYDPSGYRAANLFCQMLLIVHHKNILAILMPRILNQ